MENKKKKGKSPGKKIENIDKNKGKIQDTIQEKYRKNEEKIEKCRLVAKITNLCETLKNERN